MAQQKTDDESRPEPPEYTSITGRRADQARRIHEGNGIITPDEAAEMGLVPAIEKAYADYDPSNTMTSIRGRNPKPADGAMYFHSEWVEVEEAAEAVEYYPELSKNGFYPPEVADTLRLLPDNVLVSLGREGLPTMYVFTNRPPMVGLLREAAGNAMGMNVVENFPNDPDTEPNSALKYDGSPGGEWHLVRVQWFQ